MLVRWLSEYVQDPQSEIPYAEDSSTFAKQLLPTDSHSTTCSPSCSHSPSRGYCSLPFIDQLGRALFTWREENILPVGHLQHTFSGLTQVETSAELMRSISTGDLDAFIQCCTNPSTDAKLKRTATFEFLERIGGARGLLTLLGFRETIGSRNCAPLTRSQCVKAFEQPRTGSSLSVGGKAFTKHCERSSSGWWGIIKGNDAAKNEAARLKLESLLNEAVWKNIHSLPHGHVTMEVRNAQGYGARWYIADQSFRGFLEPPMQDGHAVGWRH